MFVLELIAVRIDTGLLSVYAPHDGWNSGELACGGQLTKEQVHIAYRGWKRMGCGRQVLVCTKATQRCVLARVQDAGPFGIITGPLKGAYPKRWRVHTGPGKPPPGWRYRAAVDLSWGLWKRLGRPRGLSPVRLVFLPRALSSWIHDWLQKLEGSPLLLS
jgi:hypothetical protein